MSCFRVNYPEAQGKQVNTSSKSSNIIPVKATGFGYTKQEALEEALVNAVQQAAPGYIIGSREVQGNVLMKSVVRQQIYGYIKGFDKSYKALNGGYEATVHANVSETPIRQDSEVVKAIQYALGNPKLMVVIGEHYNFKHDKIFTAETQIAGKLKELGFEIINYNQLTKNEKNRLFNLDETIVRKIGKLNNQPFFIIAGDASLTKKESLLGSSGLSTYTGHLKIEVINPQTAESLSAFTISPENIVGSSNLDASSNLLIDLANIAVKKHLDKQLRDIWMNFFNNGIPLKILVTNLKSFNASYTTFNCLKKIGGVKHYEHGDWNDEKNEVEIKLNFRGKSEDLAYLMEKKCNINISHVHKLFIEAKHKSQ